MSFKLLFFLKLAVSSKKALTATTAIPFYIEGGKFLTWQRKLLR
ncbi:MAG: hypothetical protein QXF56_05405 [Candidatus Micrarchaeia archaeon]